MNHSNNLTVIISVSQTRKAGVGIVSCPFMNQSEVIKGPGSWVAYYCRSGRKGSNPCHDKSGYQQLKHNPSRTVPATGEKWPLVVAPDM